MYGCIVTCIEERRVVWFSEVWKVKKNGVVRECCNEDPSRVVSSWFGCKERRGCLRVVDVITEEEQWLSMKRRL